MATVRVQFRYGKDAMMLAKLAKPVSPYAARELERTAGRYGLAGELGADEVEAIAALDLPANLREMVTGWEELAARALAYEQVRPRAYDVIRRARERMIGYAEETDG